MSSNVFTLAPDEQVIDIVDTDTKSMKVTKFLHLSASWSSRIRVREVADDMAAMGHPMGQNNIASTIFNLMEEGYLKRIGNHTGGPTDPFEYKIVKSLLRKINGPKRKAPRKFTKKAKVKEVENFDLLQFPELLDDKPRNESEENLEIAINTIKNLFAEARKDITQFSDEELIDELSRRVKAKEGK